MTKKTNLYAKVTRNILSQLEAGTRPWHKPWDARHAAGSISQPLRHNAVPYSGINILILWEAADEQSFANPFWLTFKQVGLLGGKVKKGSKSTPIVFASTFTKTETSKDGEDLERAIPFLRRYNVFNAEQCDQLPKHFTATKRPLSSIQRDQAFDQFIEATGATIETGGNKAFFAPSKDQIKMPPIASFESTEDYSAVLAHELIHWTGSEARLNRSFDSKRFADHGYAMEELVAEMGAAFLCAELGLTPAVRQDHASYLATWINVLDEDTRAIFTAARHASRAVQYLLELQRKTREQS